MKNTLIRILGGVPKEDVWWVLGFIEKIHPVDIPPSDPDDIAEVNYFRGKKFATESIFKSLRGYFEGYFNTTQ